MANHLSHAQHVGKPWLVINIIEVLVVVAKNGLVNALFSLGFAQDLQVLELAIILLKEWLVSAVLAISHAVGVLHKLWASLTFKGHDPWREENVVSKGLGVRGEILNEHLIEVEHGRVPQLELHPIVWVFKSQVDVDVDDVSCIVFGISSLEQLTLHSVDLEVWDIEVVADLCLLSLSILRLPKSEVVIVEILVHDNDGLEAKVLRLLSLHDMGAATVLEEDDGLCTQRRVDGFGVVPDVIRVLFEISVKERSASITI